MISLEVMADEKAALTLPPLKGDGILGSLHDLVGGTCVIRGCVLKKLMVYVSGFSHAYQDALGYGWSEIQSSFDWQRLIAAKDQEIARLNQLHSRLLKEAGVELIQGHATFLADFSRSPTLYCSSAVGAGMNTGIKTRRTLTAFLRIRNKEGCSLVFICL